MKPAALVRERGELRLSGASLTALMSAVLDKGKAFRFRAGGWSMSPFIKDGDVITVAPLRGRDPRTGEIVAFLHPAAGRVAVHRIIRAAPGAFLVRGDNTHEPDGLLARDRILGVVTEVRRDGDRVRGLSGRWPRIVALFSRSGGLVRGLGILRRIAGRAGRGSS
jgi:Peptidase S24-like